MLPFGKHDGKGSVNKEVQQPRSHKSKIGIRGHAEQFDDARLHRVGGKIVLLRRRVQDETIFAGHIIEQLGMTLEEAHRVDARQKAQRPQHGLEHRKVDPLLVADLVRSEEHTSELQSLMRISYAVFCLQKKNK